jgi:hypothetical protein
MACEMAEQHRKSSSSAEVINPPRLTTRTPTVPELEIEKSIWTCIDGALATSPSVEELSDLDIRETCKTKIKLLLKRFVLWVLRKTL